MINSIFIRYKFDQELLTLRRTTITLFSLKPIIVFLKKTFFPSTVIESNNLDPNLRNPDTYGTLKNTILKFISPSANIVFK